MSLKDFLENLEIGDDKIKLSKEDISNIMAESGKVVANETEKVKAKYVEDINGYKTTINDLKTQIEKAPKTDDLESLKTKIADYEAKEEKRIADEKARQEDEKLTNNILNSFEGKTFTSEYAKQGLLADVKTALKKDENAGKGIKDLIEELTKDRSDIFASPNQFSDMTGMGDVDNDQANVKMGEIKLNPMFKNYNN